MRHEEFRTTFAGLVQQEEEHRRQEAEFKVKLWASAVHGICFMCFQCVGSILMHDSHVKTCYHRARDVLAICRRALPGQVYPSKPRRAMRR